MQTEHELKSCPFCGGEAEHLLDQTTEQNHSVNCKKCCFSISRFYHGNSYLDKWNTRHAPDVSGADVGEILEVFDNCIRLAKPTEYSDTVILDCFPLSLAYEIRNLIRNLLQRPDVDLGMVLGALKGAKSVTSSVNHGKHHAIKRNDGNVLYGQTNEWCEWALKEVTPQIKKAIAHLEAAGVK